MTVTDVRAPGSTEILVDTVLGVGASFYASMGTPHTFIDPVTNESITVISEATAVDFAGHINSGKVEIDAIAPGYTDDGSKVDDIIIIRPVTEWANNLANVVQGLQDASTDFAGHFANFLADGGAWAALTGLAAGGASGHVYYGGVKYSLPAVATHTFTASRDTYVDYAPVAGTYAYVAATNGAAEPALTASSVRIAEVVTSGSAVTSVDQKFYNQPVTTANIAENAASKETALLNNVALTAQSLSTGTLDLTNTSGSFISDSAGTLHFTGSVGIIKTTTAATLTVNLVVNSTTKSISVFAAINVYTVVPIDMIFPGIPAGSTTYKLQMSTATNGVSVDGNGFATLNVKETKR